MIFLIPKNSLTFDIISKRFDLSTSQSEGKLYVNYFKVDNDALQEFSIFCGKKMITTMICPCK